jgi:broad specificity phosphatase PhoE
LVRHAESQGNLADSRAREAKADRLDLDDRDADVRLSPTGREQAEALAAWLVGKDGADYRPDVVISSPFRRASETADLATVGSGIEVTYDERLRERDLGLFDGLTGHGIRSRYPEEAERRKRLGKFYYQPPSGESWCDVVLRVRSFLRDLENGLAERRVWLVTHQAVIMAHRFALEELSEEQLLEIDRQTPIPNASLTTYERTGDTFALQRFADASAVEAIDAEVTHEPAPHHHDDEGNDEQA